MINVRSTTTVPFLCMIVLFFLLSDADAWADNDISEILTFAEKYNTHEKNGINLKQSGITSISKEDINKRPEKDNSELHQAIRLRDEKLVKQQKIIAENELLLEKFRNSVTEAKNTHEMTESNNITSHLRKDIIPAIMSFLRRNADELLLREKLREVNLSLDKKNKELFESNQLLASIKLAKADQEDIIHKKDAELSKLLKQNNLKNRISQLELQQLRTATERQAYATGSSLGRDIVRLLDERKSWGLAINRPAVLSGVIDSFAGKYKLEADELKTSLSESESLVKKARDKFSLIQQKKGDAYSLHFKGQKGVKASPSGFLFRVDYPGDMPIKPGAVVEVVVKESLVDGTVIQDMELGSKKLSQPLTAFPPLFQEAIGLLHNHGSLTMVVPPTLAYGEDGYPPKVPPNATMIYELRIVDVK